MNNPWIVAGLVGLALVCGGLFIAAFIFLFRFAGERTFTVNTAAAGGNASLIASSE